jgi:hypothetical protein
LFAFSLLLIILIFHKEKQIKQIKTNFKNNKIIQRRKKQKIRQSVGKKKIEMSGEKEKKRLRFFVSVYDMEYNRKPHRATQQATVPVP